MLEIFLKTLRSAAEVLRLFINKVTASRSAKRFTCMLQRKAYDKQQSPIRCLATYPRPQSPSTRPL